MSYQLYFCVCYVFSILILVKNVSTLIIHLCMLYWVCEFYLRQIVLFSFYLWEGILLYSALFLFLLSPCSFLDF